ALDVPSAWSTGGGVGTGRRSTAAPQERCQSGGQGRLAKLRTNEMDMAVDATGRDNQILSGDHFSARPDDQPRIDSWLDERVAGFANGDDSPASNANVSFDNSPIIKNHRVGDHHVHRQFFEFSRQRRLTLAVPDDFAAAELDFLAINGEILFNF